MKEHNGIVSKLSRVDELDGLRGFLALWVVTSHILCWCGFLETIVPSYLHAIWLGCVKGGAAVETFMILSGFAISFLLHGRSQTYTAFMMGRFFRIYPVYVICLLAGWAANRLIPSILASASWQTVYFEYARSQYAAEQANTTAHIFWHLTLFNGLIPYWLLPLSTATLLPPAWSITLEWQFYLVAPLVALLVRSPVGILALFFVSWLGIHFGWPWTNPQSAFLPAQLSFFLIGIGSFHFYAWYCRSQIASNQVIFAVIALLGVALLTDGHCVALGLWVVFFGSVFIRGDDLFSQALAMIRRIALHPFPQWLGKLSYCIYLVHWPLILVLLFFFLHWPGLTSQRTAMMLFFVGIPLILSASTLLHYYVELPAMAFAKKRVGKS